MSFFSEFFNITEGAKEIAVCCPFNHFTNSGIAYKENNPSAHINTLEHLFHCKVCNTGFSEAQFICHLFDCSYMDSKRLQRCFNTNEDLIKWNEVTKLTEESKERALILGISEEVIKELNIKTPPGSLDLLSFPVFMYNHLIDVRIYSPGSKPKVRSRSNCPVGLIIPFDIWRKTPTNKFTLICAGEKDMAVARSNGFNAITLTGGEGVLPKVSKLFKDKPIAILYDNDNAGIEGAKHLALHLFQYTNQIKIVTNFHEVCTEEGEDITDFFIKYKKNKEDLIRYLKATPYYIPSEKDINCQYPVVDLITAARPENINKILQSNIQVVAVSEASFISPSAIIAEKYKQTEAKDTMQVGEFREWELTENIAQDILHMMDNNFNEETINKNIKTLLKIPHTERCIKIKILAKKTIFKCYITDMFETTDTSIQPMEFTAYSIGAKLESGKRYLVKHKLIPHPYKGQQLIMIIINAVQANDSVSNFIVTESVKEKLNIIKTLKGTVEERITIITEKFKSFLGYNGNNILIQSIDFAYHTVLQFNFGLFKNIRGYLDTLIVGESRVGKSSTAETMRILYGLGVFTSLAGNSATIPGLIGGSNKTSGGTYQTRAGIIPQNHRGLIIFEEFGKSNANVIAELTDIRSSNEVRITRVSGTITLPAIVRMIALTNVKNKDNTIKSIASYPNGFSIIMELVNTAEDIARYDLIVVLADQGTAQIDPFWKAPLPFDKEIYQTRIRWVWSRTAEQIIINREVELYIINRANYLNELYGCHIKLFGTEAWKKISRLAIAIAGYLISTDDEFNNIIVTKEHVDYAEKFFKEIYDNSTFKLKEYVEHERKFIEVNEEAINNLQDIYNKNPSLILQLEQCSSATKNMLGAASGLSNEELNKALNRLTKGLFIRFANHDIIPTERFRLTLVKIKRNTFVKRVGE